MSIAILFTDTPLQASRFGTFADQTAALLGSNNTYKTYRVKSHLELPSSLEELKAIVITGSRSDSFNNNEEWFVKLEQFLQKALFHSQVPIIGICFGHQVVAKLLSLKSSGEENVGRNPQGWEYGLTEIQTSSKFSDLVKKMTGKQVTSLCLMEQHQDSVYKCPQGVENIGSSSKCEVQGVFSDRILTFQGHPEFSNDFYNEVVRVNNEKAGRACNLQEGRNDGEFIGEFINKWLEGGK